MKDKPSQSKSKSPMKKSEISKKEKLTGKILEKRVNKGKKGLICA